jgi:hypothetical protein
MNSDEKREYVAVVGVLEEKLKAVCDGLPTLVKVAALFQCLEKELHHNADENLRLNASALLEGLVDHLRNGDGQGGS